jgi:Nup93/Nic96
MWFISAGVNQFDQSIGMLDEFAETVLEYFNSEEFSSKPYLYAQMLFTAQRFGDAVCYLFNNRQMFAAVHVLNVCLYYGLLLPHTPLSSTVSDMMPYDILKQVQEYWSVDLCTLAEYLFSLQSDPRMIKSERTRTECLKHLESALKELLNKPYTNTKDLVGELDKGRNRGRTGVFDHYLDPADVVRLINEAARERIQSNPEDYGVIEFFELAGNDADAINMACRHLSSVISAREKQPSIDELEERKKFMSR